MINDFSSSNNLDLLKEKHTLAIWTCMIGSVRPEKMDGLEDKNALLLEIDLPI